MVPPAITARKAKVEFEVRLPDVFCGKDECGRLDGNVCNFTGGEREYGQPCVMNQGSGVERE